MHVFKFPGNIRRRDDIQRYWYFNCACQRCLDPTEMGTYMSAIRCNQCDEVGRKEKTIACRACFNGAFFFTTCSELWDF